MAHPTQKSKQLAGLILKAEASRLALTETHAHFKRKLDLPSRIKSSITGAPSKWLGGALVAGLTSSFLFRPGKRKETEREKQVKKQRGFLFGLLALIFTLSKPAAKIYATRLLKDYLARRFNTGAQGRPRVMRTSSY
jgi:hypothetical protein